jgi:hypothetical protein
MTSWTGYRPDSRPVPAQDNTTLQNADTLSMPRAGFKPTIPVLERSKTVRALDCAVIGTGVYSYIRGPFEKFVDWRQCAAVMQSEAGGNVVVT